MLLFLALLDLPIGYYTFLRISITTVATIVVITEISKNFNGWIIAFGAIAILFNPFIPIYLQDKDLWLIPDVTSGILFTAKAISITKPPKQ